MKTASLIAGLMALFVTLPIWFYLMYYLLVAVTASDLAFFLFWVYVPITVFIHVIAKIAESVK